MRTEKTIRLLIIVVVGVLWMGHAVAQTTPPWPPPQPQAEPRAAPRATTAPRRSSRVVVENAAAARQIVTILHRLNGLKVFRLLLRSHEQVGAIAKLDEAFHMTGEIHTNVIAGLALDDGRTIAAWLPEAEAEMPAPPMLFAPKPTAPPATAPDAPTGVSAAGKSPTAIAALPAITGFSPVPFAGNFFEAPDLKIVTRDGKKLLGRYVGLDGLTGLSVIVLADGGLRPLVESREETVTLGQRLRLIGPEPASPSEPGTRGGTYVRIGETEAWVVDVNRSPSGGLARVKIRSSKLSPANIGGVAVSDSGETLGIVDRVEGNEATIVPVALVRSAAKRVIARQASVPRPWLGVRGEPVGTLTLERIQRGGWEPERARALVEKREGIMLTGISPGSPAALAQLKPGDVILSVNKENIRNADEFSWLLEEAGPGSAVRFTVARPGTPLSEALEIKLSESPDPFFGSKLSGYVPKAFKPGSLMAQGMETIAIRPNVAMRFGASGGLLVIYVQPETAAFKAGLRPGDVIEAIDGHAVSSSAAATALLNDGDEKCTLNVVRNKQKLALTFETRINQ
ncbi:MAG: PDZ domain-containing protein [Pyrinomonadaceae bacterium]